MEPTRIAALPDVLNMDQVTKILKCVEETVVARIITGELAAVKYGRSWIFPREAFLQSLNRAALESAQSRRNAGRSETSATYVTQNSRRHRRIPPALPQL